MESPNLISDYHRDGCIRIPAFFSARELSEARRALDHYIQTIAPHVPPGDRTLESDNRTHRNLWRMEQHDPFFASLPKRAPIQSLVRSLVNGDPVLMGVETFNKPARIGSGVPPHQDNAYFCQSPPDVLTIWIALDPATEANGPIFYLKGSHLTGTHPHRPSGVAGNSMGLSSMPPHTDSDIFRGTLNPGDALIHHCQTIHWSSPNKTDSPRCGLLMVFRASHTAPDPNLQAAYTAARKQPA